MTEIEELVQKAIDGDSSAYTALYKLARRQVYFTCLSLVKNQADAEDLMQETFFTVMVKLPTLTDKNSFQAWTNRIAVNKCKNFLAKRTNLSYEEEIEDNGLEIPDEDIALPDEYVNDEEKRKIIMDIIMTELSDVQRLTIIMFYYNEMSAAEIAEIMEVPVGTVTYRLSSARKVIKNHILKYEKENDDRLHIVLPIPFLTSLLNAEAESLNISQLATSAANAAQAVASAGEPVHSTFSRIIACISAAIIGISVAGGTMSQMDSSEEGYAYYEALDEEYQRTKNKTLSMADYLSSFWARSWNINWNGNEVYFALTESTNDYYRYSEDTNKAELIIPGKSTAKFNINGVDKECEITQQNYAYTCGYIYTTAYLVNDSDTYPGRFQFTPAILRYNTEGNLLNYIIIPDHTEDESDYCNFSINIISDGGKIYFVHYDLSALDTESTLIDANMPIEQTYYRCNLDLSGLEKDLPIGDGLMIDCCYNNTLYASDDDFNYYAYQEDTLEIIEDDYFVKNDLDIWLTFGKYMMTFDGSIYDMDTKEVLADIPTSIDRGYISYYGGDHHFYENRMFQISSEKDYENDKIPSEEGTVFEPSKYIMSISMLSDDEYLLVEPESTYFCRISTGKKQKINFPWSASDEE